MREREILERLRRNWEYYWPGCDSAALAEDVLERLEAAKRAWQLEDVSPFPAGAVALALSARRDGEAVAIKLTPRRPESKRQPDSEANSLRFWAESGAVVRLLDSRDEEQTLLLERLSPGTTLDDSGLSWLLRLEELGRLARRLHACGRPPESFGLPTMADYAGNWCELLDKEDGAELAELIRPRADDVLVHGDLHGGNALQSSHGYTVIDPHGAVGDRHAEIWVLLCSQAPDLGPDARAEAWQWLEAYCSPALLEPERAARWVVLRGRAGLVEAAHSVLPPTASELRRFAELERLVGALDR